MIHFIDEIGIFSIVVGLTLILTLFFFILKIFSSYFFKTEKSYETFQSKSFLILSISLITLLFFYSSFSEITLNFNPNRLSEQEQIQVLKSQINYLENRNHNLITSILFLLMITSFNLFTLKKNKKQ